LARPLFEIVTLPDDSDERKATMLNQRLQALDETVQRAGKRLRVQSVALAVGQNDGHPQVTILIQYETTPAGSGTPA
jgi:hypothetical protein